MGTGYWNADPELFGKNPDLYIQVRDGYIEWAELTTGDRARCAHCTNTVRVPIRKFEDVKCGWCDMSQPARAYFELNDDFLYHLNKLARTNTTAQKHKLHNRGMFDTEMDLTLDNALYNTRENSWRMNNGVMAAVPSNFGKVT